MNDDRIEDILNDDAYDESREDTLRAMISQFYGKRMRSTAVLVWAFGLIFVALTAAALITFFQVESTRSQILYASLFVCGVQMIGLMKIFAWQMIHRNSVKRAIKHLEARLEALCKTKGDGGE